MNLRLTTRKALTLTRMGIERLGNAIYQSEYEKNRDRWYAERGDRSLRLDYPDLDPNSIAFDLGGWRGDWASDIYSKYNCRVMVFEPVPDYADEINRRFERNGKIEVFTFGLGGKDEELPIFLGSEGSSTTRNRNNEGTTQTVTLRRFSDFVAEQKIEAIDLVKMNIEGGEYDLLEHLIETGIVARVKHLQIQFHDFIPNAVHRRDRIRENLAKTHSEQFNYTFVWEGWSRTG